MGVCTIPFKSCDAVLYINQNLYFTENIKKTCTFVLKV